MVILANSTIRLAELIARPPATLSHSVEASKAVLASRLLVPARA
jgi:hypothetical protein